MEKMNAFAEDTQYDISNVPGSEIAGNYEQQRTDAWAEIEELNIIKRIISVCALKIYLCSQECFALIPASPS
jgi:amphiphysin